MEHEAGSFDDEIYVELLDNNADLRKEVMILRASIKHLVEKHNVDEPKINGIPVSRWKVSGGIQ